MVAGINLAVFKNTKNLDGALKFVKFMTSDDEQKILNGAYGSLPPVKAAQSDPAFAHSGPQGPRGHARAPARRRCRRSPTRASSRPPVGTAMKDLFADAAAGKPVTTESVKAALTKAQQQMPATLSVQDRDRHRAARDEHSSASALPGERAGRRGSPAGAAAAPPARLRRASLPVPAAAARPRCSNC